MPPPTSSVDTTVSGFVNESNVAIPTTISNNPQSVTSNTPAMFPPLSSTENSITPIKITRKTSNTIRGFVSFIGPEPSPTPGPTTSNTAAMVSGSSSSTQDIKIPNKTRRKATSKRSVSSSSQPGTCSSSTTSNVKEKKEIQHAANPVKQGSSLGKRKAGLKARENIIMSAKEDKDDAYDFDDSDLETPEKKRSKTLQIPKAIAFPSLVHTNERRGEKGNYIGTHNIDSQGRLPVYAVYYPNGSLNCRVFREDCSEEIQAEFNDFFHTKGQAKMDDIDFDKEIFAHDSNLNVERTSDSKIQLKRKAVQGYLATLGVYPPTKVDENTFKVQSKVSLCTPSSDSSNETPLSSNVNVKKSSRASSKSIKSKGIAKSDLLAPIGKAPDSAPITDSASNTNAARGVIPAEESDLPVGYWKINNNVEVYAFLVGSQDNIKVRYRLHPDEVCDTVNSVPNLLPLDGSIQYRDIELNDSFNYDNEKRTVYEIVNKIQMQKQQAIQEDRSALVSVRTVKAGIVEDMPVEKAGGSGAYINSSRSARFTANNTPEQINERGVFGVLGVTKEEVAAEEEVQQDTATASTTGASSENKTTKTPDPTYQEGQLRQLKAEIKKRDKIINEREATIAELEKTIDDMNKSLTKKEMERAATTSGQRIVGDNVYDIIASGPNIEKLRTPTWKKTGNKRKSYKQWTILSEIKLELGNMSALRPTAQNDGESTFSRIPDGIQEGMLISNKSIIETAEGTFAKWLLREELPAERRLF